MIIPTPEFNPLFAQDGIPFRDKMLDYISREFGDLIAVSGLPADLRTSSHAKFAPLELETIVPEHGERKAA